MSSPTDKPLARAQAHLASARYAEAAGAFRAVLHIDPREFQAHFGLADALVARGQRAEAIEGLIQAAEACGQQDDHAAALTLYGKALSIDPGRLELHLDVAIAEAALGRDEAAQARLENLAEIYMQAGRTDEAAEVFRFIASWEEEEVEEELEELATPATTTARHTAVPMQIPTSETVVIPTILI
ncbi:MAG: tetratricopeptide repeat protein, partial [Myxococcales bacterium]|nr:tetratricopeptide repeat protein [Myxococcales bacterium]